jgi:hypothetical protein
LLTLKMIKSKKGFKILDVNSEMQMNLSAICTCIEKLCELHQFQISH